MRNLSIVLVGLALLAAFAWQWGNNSVAIESARAAQEAAQAAQEAARAAQITGAGLATVAVMDAAGRLIPWVLFLAAVCVAVWLYFRKPAGRQVVIRPRQIDERAPRQLTDGSEKADPIDQLIKLAILDRLDKQQNTNVDRFNNW